MNKFDRPRGTRDFRPDEMQKRRWLEGVFRDAFRRFGYREIATPTFESTDLFTAKSGPNVLNEIYTFKDKGDRDICLRPELTAPVIRFYVNELTHEPKPLKLFYHGSCFRYEEPQEGRYREFWQFGLELIGPEGPQADAEVISVAVAALRAAGLKNFILHVGHIGVLRALMSAFDAPPEKKADIYRRIDKDDAALADFLDESGVPPQLAGAIAQVASHRRTLKASDEHALMQYFQQAHDAVASVRNDAIDKALAELHETVRLLDAYGVHELELDLGVARGLDYYTGMVFELEAPDLGAQKQIGGGGAYTLAQLFGGEAVGTAGFGLGFDRILLALEKENAIPAPAAAADIIIIGVGPAARQRALKVATQLRAKAHRVDVDLMGRKLGKALDYAAKTGAKYAVIIGDKELERGVVTLRRMSDGAQSEASEAELSSHLA